MSKRWESLINLLMISFNNINSDYIVRSSGDHNWYSALHYRTLQRDASQKRPEFRYKINLFLFLQFLDNLTNRNGTVRIISRTVSCRQQLFSHMDCLLRKRVRTTRNLSCPPAVLLHSPPHGGTGSTCLLLLFYLLLRWSWDQRGEELRIQMLFRHLVK